MIQSKCHLDAAMMDSPASVNFYDNVIEKQFTNTIKQEHFEPDETHGGLGDFLNSEESVDLWAYLERYDHGNGSAQHSTLNTEQEFVRQLGEEHAATIPHQRLHGTADTLSPAQTAQHSDRNTHHTPGPAPRPMHYEDIGQTVDKMPLNTPHHQPQIVGDQADSIVPELTQYVVNQLEGGQFELEVETSPSMEVNSNSTCSSVASSPGLPTSSDMQAAHVSGSGKKKRLNPSPGTDEYKQKRERNNVAVRKCRMKTKQKNKELQDKVGELQGENANLKKRVEMLTKELTVLKSLFTNVNRPAPPRLEKVNVNL